MDRMKKIMISAILISSAMSVAFAQSPVDQALAEIEKNNSELAALRAGTEADKYGYKAGNALDDPEFGFDYLWSNPDVGGRKDISVTQTLDMSVLFGSKAKLAASLGELADMGYEVERQRILLEAKTVCIELIYCNAMHEELSRRLAHAAEINDAYSRMLEAGDVSLKDANEARLALSSIRGEYERNLITRSGLQQELRRLNGGQDIVLGDTGFGLAPMLPDDFGTWYEECSASSPVLAYVAQNVKVKEQEIRTGRAASAPKLTAGYMSELVKGSNFRGLTLGVSIPVWSAKNNIRQAKASYEASRLEQEDTAIRYYSGMKQLFDEAAGLRNVLAGYEESGAVAAESAALAESGFKAGEISLVEHLVGLGLYYNIVDSTLETERDYHLAIARLESYKL